MSGNVDHKEDFEKNMLDWQDIAILTIAFAMLSLMMDIHNAISTHRDGGRHHTTGGAWVIKY